jgi:nitrate/nitrite transport system permease protein
MVGKPLVGAGRLFASAAVWKKSPGVVKAWAVALLAPAVLLVGAWWVASALSSGDLPSPLATAGTFWGMISDPFYNHGPNDKGIGLQLAASLQRVLVGFALGSLVAIPLGMVLGASASARRVVDPVVQVLRPISPLAWFPVGRRCFIPPTRPPSS